MKITLGFPPPFGGTQRLPRLIGRKRALRMILTAEPIAARDAHQIGLVNDVVSVGELHGAAIALAERIVMHSPEAVTACLRSVLRGIDLPIEDGLALEASHFVQLAGTPDVARRLGNFVQKAR